MDWRAQIRQQARSNSNYKKENTGKFAYTQAPKVQKPVARIPRNYEDNPGNLRKFTDFSGSVVKSTVGAGKAVGGFLGNVAKSSFQGVVDFTEPVARVATGWYAQDQVAVESQLKFNNELRDIALRDYNSGKITKERYNTIMAEVSKNYKEINGQVDKNMSVIQNDKKRVVEGAVDTAITILSVGSYAPLKSASIGSKYLFASKSAAFTKLGSALSKVEELAGNVPSIRALLARNGAKFAGTTRGVVNQSVRDASIGIFLKQPFIYHGTIDDIKEIYKDFNEEDVSYSTIGRIAFTVTLAFDGGIFGAAGRGLQKFSNTVKTATLGRASMLDKLAMRFQDSNPRAWVDWLDGAKTTAERSKRLKYLKITQEMNLNRWKNADDAVDAIAYHVGANQSVDLANETFETFMNRQVDYLEAFEEVDKLARSGKLLDDAGQPIKAGQIAMGSFTREAREQLGSQIKNLPFQEQIKYIEDLRSQNVLWAQNEITFNRVKATIHKAAGEGGDVVDALKGLDTAKDLSRYLPKEVAEKLAKKGYVLIVPERNLNKFIPVEDTRALITNQIVEGVDTLQTVKPVPVLRNFHGALKKVGLSTEAANDVAYRQLSQSVTANLGELRIGKEFMPRSVDGYDATRAGKTILEELQNYATNKRPIFGLGKVNAITDIRQLSIGEIQEALRIGKQDAKDVARAIIDGYTQLPLELRGLGDRFVDNLFRYVPGFSKYNRVQSALRYTYNPFFRTQEVVETNLLSKIDNGNLLWGIKRAELNNGAKLLDDARFFNTGFSGAGARDDVVLGRITANLTQKQKRDLAGLGMKIAQRKGLGEGLDGLNKMIISHSDELEDALKVIVQYPSKGVISSPLVRTLNLAFFPMRYNTKVAYLAGKALAKQPPIVQYAFLNSAMDASNWLKTDEGLAWQSENSEALGVLKWITPYGSIESVLNLLNGRPDSISDIGVLGGLPAGVIFQILDSQGVFQNVPGPFKYQTPYVNPKTGQVYAEKIPESVKARASTALADLINSTFTYPGRIIGLPGKGQAIRESVGLVLQTNKDEYRYVDVSEDLTELQRRQAKLLQSKALDEMDHDELLEIFTTNKQWSIPNLAKLVGSPKVTPPKNHDILNP